MKNWIKNHKKLSIILVIIIIVIMFILIDSWVRNNQNNSACTVSCQYVQQCAGNFFDKYTWCYVPIFTTPHGTPMPGEVFPTQDSCIKYCLTQN